MRLEVTDSMQWNIASFSIAGAQLKKQISTKMQRSDDMLVYVYVWVFYLFTNIGAVW